MQNCGCKHVGGRGCCQRSRRDVATAHHPYNSRRTDAYRRRRALPTDDESYEAKVVGVLKDKWDVAPRTQSLIEQMDALKDRLRGILLQCDGIMVDAVEVLGRSEITLRQRDALRSLEIVWPKFASHASDDDLVE